MRGHLSSDWAGAGAAEMSENHNSSGSGQMRRYRLALRFPGGTMCAALYDCYLLGPAKGVGKAFSGRWSFRYRKVAVMDVLGTQAFILSGPHPQMAPFSPSSSSAGPLSSWDIGSWFLPQGLCTYDPFCLERSAFDLLIYLSLRL